MRNPVLSVVVLAFMTIGVGCVVHQHDRPPEGTPATPPATTPPAGTTATPAPTASTPPVADPNADIEADSDDPPAGTGALPAQTPVETPPATPGSAEELPPGVQDGKAASLAEGAPAGFWIWQNPTTGVWKLRTTTAKKLHTFKGRIKGVQSPIGKVKPSRTEFGDRIVRGSGGEVIFGFTTNGHIDGFDFRAKDCVRFDLQLDSGATAKKVNIGKDATAPKGNHFKLCPKR
jgi:hypothetical protein